VKTLVVDDNRHAREGLCLLLGMGAGFEEVFQASGGEAAVHLAQVIHPELVLMDVHMAGVDGLEATRRIRILEPRARIVAMSVDPKLRDKALKAGADAFIDKVELGHQLALMAGEGGPPDLGLLAIAGPPTDPRKGRGTGPAAAPDAAPE
jgi:DNA-binding NarL/FixJ family response regulator